jgi:hypothetical protein
MTGVEPFGNVDILNIDIGIAKVKGKEDILVMLAQLGPAEAPLYGYISASISFPSECEIYLFYSFTKSVILGCREIPRNDWIAIAVIRNGKKLVSATKDAKNKSVVQFRFFDNHSILGSRHLSIIEHLLLKVKEELPDTDSLYPYMLHAQPQSHIDLLKKSGYTVLWKEPYYCYTKVDYQLDPVEIETEFTFPCSNFVHGLDDKQITILCKIDHLVNADIPTILSQKVVGYTPDYLMFLLNTLPYHRLNYCLRVMKVDVPDMSNEERLSNVPKEGDVLSWCVTHRDFSTGLIGTIPSVRGFGLAKHVVNQTLNAQYFFKRSKSLPIISFGFAGVDNIASQKLMESSGYQKGDIVCWLGIDSLQ